VATRRIPDVYKPKPNPYLNTNPNPNPNPTNPTSILRKDSRKDYLAYSLKSTEIVYGFQLLTYSISTQKTANIFLLSAQSNCMSITSLFNINVLILMILHSSFLDYK